MIPPGVPHAPSMAAMTPASPLAPVAPLGLGEVLSESFGVLRRRPGLALGLSAIPTLAALGVSLVLVGSLVAAWLPLMLAVMSGDLTGFVGAIGGWMALVAVGSLVVVAAQVYVVGLLTVLSRETVHGRRPGFAELRAALRGYPARVAPLVLLALVAYVAVFAVVLAPMLAGVLALPTDPDSDAFAGGVLLSLALMFPALISLYFVVVRLVYVVPVLALEGQGGMAALRRAWGLTSGLFWRTFGYLAVAYLLVGAAGFVVNLLTQVVTLGAVGDPDSMDPFSDDFLATLVAVMAVPMVGQLVIQLFSLPFLQAVVTVMYVDRVGELAVRGGRLHSPQPAAWGGPPPYPQSPYPQPPYPQSPYPQPPYPQPPQPAYPQPPYPPPYGASWAYPQPPYGQQPPGDQRGGNQQYGQWGQNPGQQAPDPAQLWGPPRPEQPRTPDGPPAN